MTSGSLKKALKQRTYKERSQPAARSRLGMLEKHKDYVLRARDYNSKQKRIRSMRRKASMRNPDEFYHRMENSTMRDGVHRTKGSVAGGQMTGETMKMLKTQDANYVRMKATAEASKIARLQQQLHFIDADVNVPDAAAMARRRGSDEESDAFASSDDDGATAAGARDAERPVRAKHTVFLDSDEDVDDFDAAKHFETPQELAGQAWNRARTSTLREVDIQLDAADRRSLKKHAKAKLARYRELEQRMNREKKIATAVAELELQRKVAGKGRKIKIKDRTETSAPVYKWKKERKR